MVTDTVTNLPVPGKKNIDSLRLKNLLKTVVSNNKIKLSVNQKMYLSKAYFYNRRVWPNSNNYCTSFSEHTFGCLPPDESSTLQCRGNLVPHANPSNISCCWDGDLCNKVLRPMYNPLPPGSEDESGSFSENSIMSHETSIALLVSLTVCMVILIIIVAFVYLK